MVSGDFVVLPDIDGPPDSNLTQLSPAQQQLVNRYVFTAMIFTYIWSAWPIFASNNLAAATEPKEESIAQKKIQSAQTATNVMDTQRRAKETLSSMLRRIRTELAPITDTVDNRAWKG